MQFREGLLWVEVNVPQSERPLNFLVDTGSSVTAINLSTAQRLGLKLGAVVAVQGVETTLSGRWQKQFAAKIGPLKLPPQALAIDLDQLSRSCERPVDGLVGADFFRGRVVQIDFEAEKIRVSPSAASSSSLESVPIQLRDCGLRVSVGVNDHKRQWLRLDTGCAAGLQWVTSEVKFDQCTRQMAVGLAEISIPQTKTLVRLGNQRFEGVPTGLHQTDIFPGEAGLLGNGILSCFATITIDGKAGRLLLGKRRRANSP